MTEFEPTILKTVPSHWEKIKLRDLFTISYGLSESLSKIKMNSKEGTPVIRIPNVKSTGGLDLTELKYFPLDNEQKEKLKLKRGDVLFNWRNAPKWIGKSGVFDRDGDYVNASFLLKLRPHLIGYSEFVSLCLNHYRTSGFFLTIVDNAVNQANFNATKTGEVAIPLPPLPEQHRIVNKIEELFTQLDAGVDLLQKTKVLLSQYRQSVLKDAFEGKLTEEWRENRKAESSPTRFLPSGVKNPLSLARVNLPQLHKVPTTWVWTNIGILSNSMKNGIYKPKHFYSDDGIACLRMYNINKGQLVWKDIKRMKLYPEEVVEYELKPSDILVNRVNSRELVGKAALIPSGIEQCVYESKNIRLRIKDNDVCNSYVNYWFLYFGQKYFTKNTQQTVGMASINQEQLAAMPIPLPNISEQEMVVGQIERLFSIADYLEKCATQSMLLAQNTKQGILKNAFQGKLVPHDPNDEPASKLLERLKAERSGEAPRGRKPRQTKMF